MTPLQVLMLICEAEKSLAAGRRATAFALLEEADRLVPRVPGALDWLTCEWRITQAYTRAYAPRLVAS